MPSVADALRQHAPAYLRRFGDAVPMGHRKVIASITRCRTGSLGGVLYHCDGCGREHWVGRSCGNRHCPACGKEKTYAWLAKQTTRLTVIRLRKAVKVESSPSRRAIKLRLNLQIGGRFHSNQPLVQGNRITNAGSAGHFTRSPQAQDPSPRHT